MRNRLALLKRITALYFISLGIIDFFATWYNVGFHWFDFYIMLLLAFPFVINKRVYYLLFGLCSMATWAYLLFAILINPSVSSIRMQVIGYLFIILSVFMSVVLLMLYSNKKVLMVTK